MFGSQFPTTSHQQAIWTYSLSLSITVNLFLFLFKNDAQNKICKIQFITLDAEDENNSNNKKSSSSSHKYIFGALNSDGSFWIVELRVLYSFGLYNQQNQLENERKRESDKKSINLKLYAKQMHTHTQRERER